MDELVKELSSPDEASRIYAAQDMGETGHSEMAKHLINRLPKEESQAVRDSIIFALKNLPCPEIYDMLFRLFSSPDAYLRNAAIDIFGSEGNEAILFLTSHIDHADREVRKLILDALFATHVPDAVQAIRQALYDPSVNVQITAVEYLGRLEDRGSLDEVIRLIRKETEPMLIIAVLESVSLFGTKENVMDVFSILAPDGDFNQVDMLFAPQVIRVCAKTGNPYIMSKVIDSIADIEMYAEDLVAALEEANRQFKGILKEKRLFERIRTIMEQIEDQELRAVCGELIQQ